MGIVIFEESTAKEPKSKSSSADFKELFRSFYDIRNDSNTKLYHATATNSSF